MIDRAAVVEGVSAGPFSGAQELGDVAREGGNDRDQMFTVLAQNQLASGMTASPIQADGALYLRTKTHFYKVGK